MDGWIKLHRKLLDNPRFNEGDWLKVWLFLLCSATHANIRRVFGSELMTLSPGQLITSRSTISMKTDVQESKVERILKRLEIEQQIEQRSSSVSRLITIVNWGEYQEGEQEHEQQVNSDRTASEQQVNTNKNRRTEEEYNLGVPLDVELPDNFPKTVADALTVAEMNAIPKDFAETIYDLAVSRGGMDNHGQEIRDFAAYLRSQLRFKRANDHQSQLRFPQNGKPKEVPAWKQAQLVQERIDTHPANQQWIGHRHDKCTPELKAELTTMRAKLKDLKAQEAKGV